MNILVGTTVAIPATSSTLEVVDIIGTTVPHFNVGGERTTALPVKTRFSSNLIICHARVPAFQPTGSVCVTLI